MNILITGASGLLGRSLFKRLTANPAFDVTGTAFSRAGNELRQLDLTDFGQVRGQLQELRPQLVIHCAAERWPDRCAEQPDAAWALNVDSSAQLARLCNDSGAQLAYISTDYVFDGSAPPYSVDDTTNPINFYGRSKLAGENAVLANGNHWVLRVPWLFGPVLELGESGVTALLDTVRNRVPTSLDDWAIRYPTSTEDIAAVLEQSAAKIAAGEEFSGIYHWSASTACTRYGLAKLVAEACDLPADHLSGDQSPQYGEPRPHNCRLDRSRLEKMGISADEPLRQQLERYLRPFLDR
ncbi:dTDP-4-dehydrorhamnose reductase family protein [Microbulbifer hainanensis]|uniref:dTDP-4-dehydrorhamnose reductase family protein n=1 Tax=Microbulbifer hainanensis TaxID=2735675 RepID=UPI001866FE34|nr:SDR family oxidoreductase [Microbulbifer hainanensis]